MMTINDALYRIYKYGCCTRNCLNTVGIKNNIRFLDISISEDMFEIPLYAFDFLNQIAYKDYSTISTILNSGHRNSGYKTINSAVVNYINKSSAGYFISYTTKNKDNESVTYYISGGAIFNSDFKCIAMCSALVKKEVEYGEVVYKNIKPIFRIDPECFSADKDEVQKYISGKMFSTVMNISNEYNMGIKVEIDTIPFIAREVEKPSASTNRQQLLKLVEQHIDELVV